MPLHRHSKLRKLPFHIESNCIRLAKHLLMSSYRWYTQPPFGASPLSQYWVSRNFNKLLISCLQAPSVGVAHNLSIFQKHGLLFNMATAEVSVFSLCTVLITEHRMEEPEIEYFKSEEFFAYNARRALPTSTCTIHHCRSVYTASWTRFKGRDADIKIVVRNVPRGISTKKSCFPCCCTSGKD
jgi:hypothetical protein